jgi:hypothetical protein
MTSHATELTLRKLFAGETVTDELKAHSEACEQCKAKLRAIEDEQKKFEAAIPFERFAAGVERASRTPREVAKPPRKQWMGYVMAIAAGLLVVAAVPLVLRDGGPGRNNLKGSDTVEIHVAGAAGGPQRLSATNVAEALAPGERVQIGYDAKSYRFLIAVSVDDRGEISSFPDTGQSMPISGKGQLPYSIEFTGHGTEHLVVVLTREPLPVDEVRRALRVRYDEARGNLSQLGSLDVAGEQYHYTFLKP